MKKTYFMFGVYPVKYYQDNEESKMVESLKIGDGTLDVFIDGVTDIAAFMDCTLGWEDFVVLTEEEYESIKSKLI
jgi:hypothetical protein